MGSEGRGSNKPLSLASPRHRKVGIVPRVGVGGAADVGWGPCADPGSPSPPLLISAVLTLAVAVPGPHAIRTLKFAPMGLAPAFRGSPLRSFHSQYNVLI